MPIKSFRDMKPMSTRAASVFMPTCALPFIMSAGLGILAGLMVATSNAQPPAGGLAGTAAAASGFALAGGQPVWE